MAKRSNERIDPVDKHVGNRIRMRRLKKAQNRIGASRLQRMSDILKVPVAWIGIPLRIRGLSKAAAVVALGLICRPGFFSVP